MQIFDLAFRLLDQIISFLKASKASTRERFNLFFKPLYNDVQIVHKNYLSFLSEAKKVLKKSIDDPQNHKGRNDQKAMGRFKLAILTAIALLDAKRLEYEPLRRRLVHFKKDQSFQFYKADESDFLKSVGNYCMHSTSLYSTTGTAINTLDTNPDIFHAVAFLEEAISDKRKKWDEVNKKYFRLELRVWRERNIIKKCTLRAFKRKRSK